MLAAWFALLVAVCSGALFIAQQAQAAAPIMPYVYATTSSSINYDIMLADGVNKDRRVARVKVDGVAFSNIVARLSSDASLAAFRLNGDRLGGSSLYSVDLKTGKYAQITVSKTSAEGMGAFAWSPAGNTMAFVRSAPAPDPVSADDVFGSVYVFSIGYKPVKLGSSKGNDRLLGFSGDGLGVYVSRLWQSGNQKLQDLVYLPLSGEEGQVILGSQPNLKYSNYALWTPKGVPGRVAFIAEGDFTLAVSSTLTTPTGDDAHSRQSASPYTSQLPSQAPLTGRLSGQSGLGLVVANLGYAPALLRRDAEDYSFLAWKPDGSGLVAGGARSGNSWAVGLDGVRRSLNVSLRDVSAATWSADTNLLIVGDAPASRLVTVDYGTGKVAATRYVGVAVKAQAAAVRLPIPYIHQVKDTSANANGSWACGPTSIAMALAYYGKLAPWTEPTSTPSADLSPPLDSSPIVPYLTPESVVQGLTPTHKPITGADFAPYITNAYTAYGRTYSVTARDPNGNMLAGLYGTICPTGLADWGQMSSVLKSHGLNAQFVSTSWGGIVAALKRGHPVLLGNQLTSVGHIVLIIGYTPDGNLIVNDPYGNKFKPGYGGNDGNGVLYQWKLVTPRNALEIIGSR